MYSYDSTSSESLKTSRKTSTDTASNWSRPEKKETKRRIGNVPRRETRLFSQRMQNKMKLDESRSNRMKGPHLKLHRYSFKMRRIPHLTSKQTKAYIEKINDQSRLVCFLWTRCQEQTLELEAEMVRLQQRLLQLQVEEVEIKTKRWCRVCQEEATYVNAKRFYCSKECERKSDQE